jgi:hypothetical protein
MNVDEAQLLAGSANGKNSSRQADQFLLESILSISFGRTQYIDQALNRSNKSPRQWLLTAKVILYLGILFSMCYKILFVADFG